jgi:hypothetical protein
MARSKDEFVIAANRIVGDSYSIGNGTTELHFWCKHCVRGWRFTKPQTPADMGIGNLTHLLNHTASHAYKAVQRKAAR